MLSAPKIYIPQNDTWPETPAAVAQRFRLRRALMTVIELVCLGLFVGAVLLWAGQEVGR